MGDSLTALYLSNPELAGRLRRQSAAEALMKQGADTTPIRAHSQGIARVAQALMGGLELGMIDRENRADQERSRQEEADYTARLTGRRSAPPAPMAAPSGMPAAAPAMPPAMPPAAPMPAPGPTLSVSGRPAGMPAQPDGQPPLASPDLVLPAPRPGAPPALPVADQQPAPAPAGAAPPRPGGVDPDEMALLQEGLNSRNPRIRVMAENRLKVLQVERQGNQEPLVPIRRPDGTTIMVRRSQAEGMVSAAEPEPLVEVRDDTGATRFVPRSQAINMRSAAPVPQPSQIDRDEREYIALERLRLAGQLSPEQATRHALLVRRMTGQDQFSLGPNNTVIVAPPSPLPVLGTPPAAGPATIPLSGNMSQPGTQPAQPMAPPDPTASPTPMTSVPVPGGPSDASPGAIPSPGQVASQRVTTPNNRQVQVTPLAREPVNPPPQVLNGMLENAASVRKIDDAMSELRRVGETSVGLIPGNTPAFLINRTDPEGVRLRALIADIGSMKIHDRSGAAVTAAEFPRLAPFIPSPSDNETTIRDKLNNFRREYMAILNDTYQVYGPASGGRRLDPVEGIINPGPRQPGGERPPLSSFGR